MQETSFSYDVAVIQWITSSHKNGMAKRVITLWRVHITSLTTPVSTMHFLFEIMFILKVVVVVVLLFYVHGKHLRSCRDGQLT